MIKKRHLLGFILFLGGLLFCYWLPNRFYLFEPYPALLFPSGHGTFATPETSAINYKKTVIYGLDKESGKKVEIPLSNFLHPIPPHIGIHILKKEFGLYPKPIKVILGEINTVFWIKPKVNDRKIAEAKVWLGKQLISHGCIDSLFFVEQVIMEFDTKDRKRINESILGSKTIYLNHGTD